MALNVVSARLSLFALLVASCTAVALRDVPDEDKRAKTFLISFNGHAGSSALVSAMQKHSHLYVPPENEPIEHYQLDSVRALGATQDIFEMGLGKKLVPGCKLRPKHAYFNASLWRAALDMYDTKVIAQYRTNVFKSAIGLYSVSELGLNAAKRGVSDEELAHGEQIEGEVEPFAVEDLHEFYLRMRRVLVVNEDIKAFAAMRPESSILHLTYEDLVYDFQGQYDRVCDFLGVPREQHEPDYHKALMDSPCKLVTNYQELCKAFWACDAWRPFLEDPVNGCFCKEKPTTTSYPDLCQVLHSTHEYPTG